MRDLGSWMNPNKMVRHLQKPAREFTKYDIIKYIDDHHIEVTQFQVCGGRWQIQNPELRYHE